RGGGRLVLSGEGILDEGVVELAMRHVGAWFGGTGGDRSTGYDGEGDVLLRHAVRVALTPFDSPLPRRALLLEVVERHERAELRLALGERLHARLPEPAVEPASARELVGARAADAEVLPCEVGVRAGLDVEPLV